MSLVRHDSNLKQRFLMHSKTRGRPASNQASRRSIDKNLTASEEDILLQMMIKEARAREQRELKKQWEKFGIVKIQQPLPYVKIQESEAEFYEGCEQGNKRRRDKQKHFTIKKGILNMKIKGKRARVKKTSVQKTEGWFFNQSTLDRYVTNTILNSHKGKIKVNTSMSSSQTTLDSYFAIKIVQKEE